jgi:hypothetical protein
MGETTAAAAVAAVDLIFFHREDEKFFEMLFSIDEFQPPLVGTAPQSSTRTPESQRNDFELIYLYGIQETSGLFTGSFLNVFETVEV